jgi:hypothetical protein
MDAGVRRYAVIATHGCKVIEGAVPVDEFCALVQVWSKFEDPADPWIVDALLAQRLGANFVIGPTSACQEWRDKLEQT